MSMRTRTPSPKSRRRRFAETPTPSRRRPRRADAEPTPTPSRRRAGAGTPVTPSPKRRGRASSPKVGVECTPSPAKQPRKRLRLLVMSPPPPLRSCIETGVQGGDDGADADADAPLVYGKLAAVEIDREIIQPTDTQPQRCFVPFFRTVGYGDVLASAGSYTVSIAELADVPRLRELEREFVVDHFRMFRREPWQPFVPGPDWCKLVGVVHDEDDAIHSVELVVGGKMPGHATLKCVHTPSDDEDEPEIVGYVHIIAQVGVEISHLKVGRQHVGRGLGALLIGGVARLATSLGAMTAGMHLGVLTRNERAISLYENLQFSWQQSYRQPLGASEPVETEWQLMVKRLSTRESWLAFAELCEVHARVAEARRG